jgi:arylsulfatase A-like enzyme
MRYIFLALFLNVVPFEDCLSQHSTGAILQSAKKREALNEKGGQPNIIFIFIDDMGYADLSSFGNRKIQTPNIDRLAAEGIRFTNFYANAPLCSPSRVAVMTGQYPARNGVHAVLATRKRNEKYGMADFLAPSAPSLGRAMKGAGYVTAHFGKWHMGGGRDVGDAPRPQAYGFDESLVSFEGLGDRLLIKGHGLSEASAKLGQGKISWVEKHEQTPIYVDRTIDFIRRHKEEPFYIHLWPNDVHDPFNPKQAHQEHFGYYANNPYEQDFLAVLYQLDQQIGRLLDVLDALKLTENTLVVLTSDNGPTDWPRYYEQYFAPPGSADPFRGRKWSLYEGGIREPFMARWPGQIPAGVTNDSTVMHAADLFPTLCRLAGVALPQMDFDGEDMSKALRGEGQQRTKPVFWEYGRDDSYMKPGNPRFVSPNLAMREGQWKLLVNDDGTQLGLYNLLKDHAETNNVAEKYPAIAKQMRQQLLEWRRTLP